MHAFEEIKTLHVEHPSEEGNVVSWSSGVFFGFVQSLGFNTVYVIANRVVVKDDRWWLFYFID